MVAFKRLPLVPRKRKSGAPHDISKTSHLHSGPPPSAWSVGAAELDGTDAAELMETALFNVIDAISYSDDPERYAKACSHVDPDTVAALPEPHSVVYAKIAIACSQLPSAETPDEEAFWRWGVLRPTFLWICAHGNGYVRSRVGGACKVGQRKTHAQAATERYNDKGNGPDLDWYSIKVAP